MIQRHLIKSTIDRVTRGCRAAFRETCKINFLKIIHSRNLLWQLPLLIVVLSPIWWGAAADFLTIEAMRHGQGAAVHPQSSFAMQRVKISQAENGKEEIRLDAPRLYSEGDQDVLIFEEPVTQLVGNKDKPVTIKGGSAVYETKKQIITLLDDVELISADTRVTTSALRYMTKYKKIKSAAAVEVDTDGMRIAGTSFFYDLVSGDFRVGKRVVCNIW
jgi:LPS export ABC transporter protein LptC